ncbi:penicillin-binding protein activator [Pseudorhodobacter turbinis]|uniref:Penicillin-binding protein activator n=1 Tax=Pseudorhodobacter turbinis TaxID=2500533 RepID=A0A4P8EGX3_9RHOB|nr:penicillin-binding protein activator [Pseudorhodobacter turbinis]QCO56410.1 penicillin-binding protein activator [Pseudorhodobacter turbinis]
MLSFFKTARKSLTRAGLAVAAITLAACQPVGVGGPAIDTSAPVPVALLVPSGSGSAGDDVLATSLQNAARLAIADLGNVKIDLRVYSTGGKPAGAQAAAIKAVDEGAKIILGPVFAQNANAAGVAVAGRGVNVLSFSNNTDIAGGNVFVLGPTFANTANRLASYSVGQGKRNILIVNDRTPAGEIGRVAIERGVSRAGGSVVARVGYEFSQNGIVSAAPEIAAKVRSTGAQAVFMTADTAGALPLLTQMLRDNRVDPSVAQFIGLTRWDIPAATMSLPGVQGGWFAMPDPALYQRYQSRYMSAYGTPPHPISGLAYDGIAAIGALVKSGNTNALTAQALTQSSGFVGVNGIFRLRSDGTNERGLAVAQISNNQLVIIDAAPRSFGGAGY